MPAPLPVQASADVLTTVMTTAGNGADYIALSRPGTVLRVDITNAAAIATANLTLTMAYAPPGSTTFTDLGSGAVTIANATVAGTTTTITPTPTYVQDGGSLRITRSGGATGGANLNVSVLLGP